MWWGLAVLVAAAMAAPREPICGYDRCPVGEPGMLNVHLVPHTHDDVGWLKTVDQYFYGAKNDIQRAGVQYILDSVVEELVRDPERRFIYVETAFFWRWYRQQDEEMKATIETLVNEGRLEFIGGGWSMNDEACVHYNAVVDQMSLGMRMLRDTFGKCGVPRVAWQIDPFGHTKEQANLFAQMGFDGLFFARIDYDDRKRRINESKLEVVWRAAHDGDPNGDMFTGILYRHYSPPPGHCYDVNCNDPPIMDDKRLKDYNVNSKVDNFIDFSKEKSEAYRTSHIMMTMGDDFNYQDANMWFKNIDKLIKYVNERQSGGETVNLMYSTPSCYLKALHESGIEWPEFQNDFVPYASDPWAYWTGYYSSRAAQKGYIRKSNHFLQICKQLSAMFQTERLQERPNRVDLLRNAMALNQHHDAVTGTEKQHVADDYVQRLSEGTAACQEVVDESLTLAGLPEQSFCNHLNSSACEVSEENSKFVAYVYNPLARRISPWVRVPVNGQSAIVVNDQGATIDSQLSPIPQQVLNLPGRKSTATFELVFQANDLPPLGFKAYYVRVFPFIAASQHAIKRTGLHMLSNGRISLHIDPDSLRLGQFQAGKSNVNVNQTFMWYQGYGSPHNTPWEPWHRPSGAYVFHPEGDAKPVKATRVLTLDGPLVKEFHHKFEIDWVSQVTRLYKDEKFAEMEWLVGPIPIEDGKAKEVISRFSTDIMSDDAFYTDSNGRQMMERRRNHRSAWKLNITEPVAGNYFPVNSRIFIKDSVSQLTVLTDRSQGGSSLKSGQLELMLHRRTVQDDAFGVGEPLNEKAFGVGLVVRGKHWVLVSDPESSARLHRDLGEQMFMAPQISFAPAPMMTMRRWLESTTVKQFTGMQALPANVHLLSLETYEPGRLLIRLEHQFEAGEDPELSRPVQVDLGDLFTTLKLTSVEEFGLSADRPVSDISRLHWNTTQSSRRGETFTRAGGTKTKLKTDALTITLNPMEIRTFVAEFEGRLEKKAD